MKTDKLRQRLQKNRPMVMISLRIPEDVVDDLKRIAPIMGFSGYQPLIRAYIGQGLRADMEQLEKSVDSTALIESLQKYGVDEEILASAIAEIREQGPDYDVE